MITLWNKFLFEHFSLKSFFSHLNLIFSLCSFNKTTLMGFFMDHSLISETFIAFVSRNFLKLKMNLILSEIMCGILNEKNRFSRMIYVSRSDNLEITGPILRWKFKSTLEKHKNDLEFLKIYLRKLINSSRNFNLKKNWLETKTVEFLRDIIIYVVTFTQHFFIRSVVEARQITTIISRHPSKTSYSCPTFFSIQKKSPIINFLLSPYFKQSLIMRNSNARIVRCGEGGGEVKSPL